MAHPNRRSLVFVACLTLCLFFPGTALAMEKRSSADDLIAAAHPIEQTKTKGDQPC
ncbi:hypothetical protein MSL71_9960 [Desulfoluna butyratoxydans]|uniref:Uncharacterized protein n=1 Tax=Desulfoluna butyratoxydans TaxID=231438 RepID=A0A4V6IL24_9BACT|nr:hypothetical protein MSL71_9960 [Desulfoluna butyratoxydans]